MVSYTSDSKSNLVAPMNEKTGEAIALLYRAHLDRLTDRYDKALEDAGFDAAVIGAGISTYHYLIEWGVLADSENCALFGPSCSAVWYREFGFVTMAFAALAGFVAIIVLNTVSFDSVRSSQETS